METLAGFAFPESCRVAQRVPKTLFAERTAFGAAEKRLFKDEVAEVRCEYVLDAAKTRLSPVVDEERDHSCLAVIAVDLRETKHVTRIAEIIHKAMPYPLLIVMNGPRGARALPCVDGHAGRVTLPCVGGHAGCVTLPCVGGHAGCVTLPCVGGHAGCVTLPCVGGHAGRVTLPDDGRTVAPRPPFCAFSLADKRLSHDGRETTVIERLTVSACHDVAALDDFFTASAFPQFPGRTFAELYRWYGERMDALAAADETGHFAVAGKDPEKRRAALARIHALDVQLAELRRQAKPSLTLAEKIALNTKIKALERDRDAAKEVL